MALFGRNKRPEGTYVALDYDSTWGGGLYLTFESDSIVQVEEDYDEFEFNYTIENGDQIFIDNGRMVLTYDRGDDTLWLDEEGLLFTKLR